MGHKRPTNKLCKFYKGKKAEKTGESETPPVVASSELQQIADEMDLLDALPLDSEESEAFYSAASEFSYGTL